MTSAILGSTLCSVGNCRYMLNRDHRVAFNCCPFLVFYAKHTDMWPVGNVCRFVSVSDSGFLAQELTGE